MNKNSRDSFDFESINYDFADLSDKQLEYLFHPSVNRFETFSQRAQIIEQARADEMKESRDHTIRKARMVDQQIRMGYENGITKKKYPNGIVQKQYIHPHIYNLPEGKKVLIVR